MKEEIDQGNIVFGPDETTIPGVRRSLFEKDIQVMRSVTFSYAQKASQDFAKIFDGKKIFDNPKSYLDMERLVAYLSSPGDLVLDFFAGPIGTYNPDWAILKHDGQALYLVRETKGTRDFLQLRTSEADKIRCGKQHFETIGVPFAVAVSADEV